jgi:hypothetical protein
MPAHVCSAPGYGSVFVKEKKIKKFDNIKKEWEREKDNTRDTN